MRNLKSALVALSILFVASFAGGLVADWTSGALPGSVDLVESALGAFAFSLATLLSVGTVLVVVAKRTGLHSKPLQLALLGFSTGAMSMAAAVALVDGLPFYIPYDLVLVIFLGIGGAISSLYWAKHSSHDLADNA